MANPQKNLDFYLCSHFRYPVTANIMLPGKGFPKKNRLMNYDNIRHLLEDVDWLWMKDLLHRMETGRSKTEKSSCLIF
jgi:hypothetical protein